MRNKRIKTLRSYSILVISYVSPFMSEESMDEQIKYTGKQQDESIKHTAHSNYTSN